MTGLLEVASGELQRLFRLEGSWSWSRDSRGERLLLREHVGNLSARLWLASLEEGDMTPVEAPGDERLVGDHLVPLAGPLVGPGPGSRLLSRPGPPNWRPGVQPAGRELLLLDLETLQLRVVLAAR